MGRARAKPINHQLQIMKTMIKRRPLPDSLPELEGISPLLQRIYAARQIKSSAELDYSVSQLLPFDQLKGMDAAIQILSAVLTAQKRVLVVGDFDCDGATSTALAVKGLRAFGFTQVDYLVPNRFEYGYGLTPEIVEVALKYKPDLIITVDNGISSIEGVAAAKANGVQVLVTDHHLAGTQLPLADAIVNPNQPGDKFASKNLAGVGVMFYVLMALRAHLREQDWFEKNNIKEPNLAQWLDLVAMGTVADVVALDHNNRILVSQGLARMRAGQLCVGLKAMATVAGRQLGSLSSSDIGFAIAPRFNAAGRLDDMSLGIECLLTTDEQTAQALAQQLDQLNRERRIIEDEMKQQALNLLANMRLNDNDKNLPVGLCLFEPEWHEGVVGILASRIKERLHRPVIAFARTANNQIKGSARSIKGVHIRDVLDAVAARHPDLLSRFGGHAMAAGLSLTEEHYEPFAQAFDEEIRRHLDADCLQGLIESDGELCADEQTIETAELLGQAGPWGQGFEEPLFEGCFRLLQTRIVGEKHLKMMLENENGRAIDAIAFNAGDSHWPKNVERLRVAYRLEINEFRNERKLQFIVQHLVPEINAEILLNNDRE
ncbi:Single-stranded-DNA-specific exonuclease RecJ [hydrothermal vent metagenome]|uniref:Single-stranded-DNA-specific exonuclease RecJ n=1 Tax=hydrothermal vent metagenome TaxID=652676 RepID=A0A3B1BLW9_9ZZZZ